MASQRIEYIDYLKGLTVVLVVWFHATYHPAFLDFPFRMPLFFFVSGVFFKAYPWPVFWRKKVNQLFIPFLFFMGLAVGYELIAGGDTLQRDIIGMFGDAYRDVFAIHDQYNGLKYNPPLWFIMSLIDIQLMLYVLKRFIKSTRVLLILSLCITVAGELWIQWLPTFFMFGDACGHFFYYVAGCVAGRRFMNMIDSDYSTTRRWFSIVGLCVAVCVVAFGIEKTVTKLHLMPEWFPIWILRFPRICALIPLCILLMKRLYMLPVLQPLKFFGANSYVVLGTHWMLIRGLFEGTLYHDIIGRTPGLLESCGLTLLTLLIIAGLAVLFNRFIPMLVAKKEVFPIERMTEDKTAGDVDVIKEIETI